MLDEVPTPRIRCSPTGSVRDIRGMTGYRDQNRGVCPGHASCAEPGGGGLLNRSRYFSCPIDRRQAVNSGRSEKPATANGSIDAGATMAGTTFASKGPAVQSPERKWNLCPTRATMISLNASPSTCHP
jgi:hypothetical protein